MRKQKLVVAILSRTFFNPDESHVIFETQGNEVFCRLEILNKPAYYKSLEFPFIRLQPYKLCPIAINPYIFRPVIRR